MITALLERYLSFALPGLGMFSEAYIIFSAGQISQFQDVLYPKCFESYDYCPEELIKQKVVDYIQIVGVMLGMMVMGFLGDLVGRKWGSKMVAAIMLSGAVALAISPFTTGSHAYFIFFLVAQTWYGIGVGGEYPMASSSASEKANVSAEFRAHRGREVVLVFSNQGMGNLVNSIVILLAMGIFGETKLDLTQEGSRKVLFAMYFIGAAVCLVMVVYRFTFLEESEMFEQQKQKKSEAASTSRPFTKYIYLYWPRQFVASVAWVANDFAFYGNKLQQSRFIDFLYPDATPYVKMQWTVLNSFISLLGYYAAALLVDKPWYGRRRCQNIGFLTMCICYGAIYIDWDFMSSSTSGIHIFQILYFLSSFFNQFGPNSTTWLVAGEIFPTEIRTMNHGIAAAMGKLGAIISTVWIINISSDKEIFFVSAIWALLGFAVTSTFLPDTTGLELSELDVFNEHAIKGDIEKYSGEAINPMHLSVFERYVFGWGKHYRPVPADEETAQECSSNDNSTYSPLANA